MSHYKLLLLIVACFTVVWIEAMEIMEAEKDKSLDGFEKAHAWEEERAFNKKEIMCILYDKHCNKRLSEVKGTMLKAFKNGCSDCGPEDKEAAGRAMAILLHKQPLVWKRFSRDQDESDSIYGKRA